MGLPQNPVSIPIGIPDRPRFNNDQFRFTSNRGSLNKEEEPLGNEVTGLRCPVKETVVTEVPPLCHEESQ